MLLDLKKFERLLAEGQRRHDELAKGLAPLQADYEKAGAAVAELQREQADLKQRLAAADRGQLNLSEAEIAAAGDRVRSLQGAIERANIKRSEALKVLKAAENTARGAMQPLKTEAINAWLEEFNAADREYIAAWKRL